MLKPYIGITGVTSTNEVNDVSREFYEAGYNENSEHLPMIGCLVSYKTIKGESIKSKRYPKFDSLYRLMTQAKNNIFTMIHYYSEKPSSLSDQINLFFNGLYEQDLCKRLQLNIDWPEIGQLRLIKNKFPEMEIVFQASYGIMESSGNKEVISGIEKYGSLIDYILIDPSGGKSLEFDMNKSLDFYKEIKERIPMMSIGFAGGFHADNVLNRIKNLVNMLGNSSFSIDAEGGLRDKISDEIGNDILSTEKTRRYLRNTSQILK